MDARCLEREWDFFILILMLPIALLASYQSLRILWSRDTAIAAKLRLVLVVCIFILWQVYFLWRG
jgi:hypothetical protein